MNPLAPDPTLIWAAPTPPSSDIINTQLTTQPTLVFSQPQNTAAGSTPRAVNSQPADDQQIPAGIVAPGLNAFPYQIVVQPLTADPQPNGADQVTQAASQLPSQPLDQPPATQPQAQDQQVAAAPVLISAPVVDQSVSQIAAPAWANQAFYPFVLQAPDQAPSTSEPVTSASPIPTASADSDNPATLFSNDDTDPAALRTPTLQEFNSTVGDQDLHDGESPEDEDDDEANDQGGENSEDEYEPQ